MTRLQVGSCSGGIRVQRAQPGGEDPKAYPASARASTMTSLAHRVDRQLAQHCREEEIEEAGDKKTGRARMRSSDTELVVGKEGKRPVPAA